MPYRTAKKLPERTAARRISGAVHLQRRSMFVGQMDVAEDCGTEADGKRQNTRERRPLASDINQTGHAAVYGIHFDIGTAIIKPESQAVLAEIGKLLASDPALKLHVIGHTDNAGSLADNMALSRKRADAVVAALVSNYHVPAGRLQSAGIGPFVGGREQSHGRRPGKESTG